jgi:hypothetical protein
VGWIVATCMVFSDTRQTLWDRLASTLVVDGYVDVRPEELPASQGFDNAPYARKDRNLVFAGVGALVVLIVGGIVIGPGLVTSTRTNNANTVGVPGTETPSSSAGSSYGSTSPNYGSTASPDFTTGSADGLITIVPDPGASWSADVSAHVVDVLHRYFSGINNRDPASAWATYSPKLQAKIPLAGWSQGVAGSYDSQVVIHAVTPSSAADGVDPVQARVTFTSQQPGDLGPNPGETCTNWALTYSLVPTNGSYLIDAVNTTSGTRHTPC